MPRTAHAIPTLIIALVAAQLSMADLIALRSSVRLADESMTVHLRDIAELSGADAERLGDLVIATLTDRAKAVEIPLRDIRTKLDNAGVHWGRVNLNGRGVVVRPRPLGAAGPVQAMMSLAIDGQENQTPEESAAPQLATATDLIDEPTLRGAIARYVAHNLRLDPARVRLGFDDRQAELLDMAESEHRFEIEPASSLASPRVDLTVRVWDGGHVADRHTITVMPLVLQSVVRVRHEIDRNALITNADLETVEDWLPPHQPAVIASVHEAVGQTASVRLREGEVVRSTQLRRETLIERGEQVIVRCLVGGSVISLQAEARAEGAEGDTIEFRKLGERESFLATVTGRKEATINLSR